MKSKFLQISLGVTMILLSVGFVLRSIGTLNASPNTVRSFQDGATNIGKYTFQYLSREGQYPQLFIWNTETGKSEAYYFRSEQWVKWNYFPQGPFGI